MKLFDLYYQLSFYAKFHSNNSNILIHRLCVPIILWTSIGMLSDLSKAEDVLDFNNYGTILTFIYAIYYFTLSIPLAVSYIPQLIFMLYTSNALCQYTSSSFTIFLGFHVFSWLAQFYGHIVHEGNRPALLDNIISSVLLAPFFVHIENCFAMGYCKDLHRCIRNEDSKQTHESH